MSMDHERQPEEGVKGVSDDDSDDKGCYFLLQMPEQGAEGLKKGENCEVFVRERDRNSVAHRPASFDELEKVTPERVAEGLKKGENWVVFVETLDQIQEFEYLSDLIFWEPEIKRDWIRDKIMDAWIYERRYRFGPTFQVRNGFSKEVVEGIPGHVKLGRGN